LKKEKWMAQRLVRNRFRFTFWFLLLTFLPAAFADLIQPLPFLPPAGAQYDVADTCIPQVCLGDIAISNFVVTSNTISGGNENVDTTATLSADVFQNNGGTPGALIGAVALSGPVDFTYFDKDTFSEFGTFDSQITDLDLTGSFNGLTGTHTLEAQLNPAESTLGSTTVEPVGGGLYDVASFFDIFTELSIDGGTFIPGPERVVDLTASTPEPASTGLAIAGFLAVAGLHWRRKMQRSRAIRQ
jgi:hypothetical protein